MKDFFQNSYNLVSFVIAIIGIALAIWALIKKYPKKVSLYFQGSVPLMNYHLPDLKSIATDSKIIPIQNDHFYSISTFLLQNTGNSDLKRSDFEYGIKIEFPEEYKILDVRSIDYPIEVKSNCQIIKSEIDINFALLKKKEIIRIDVWGERKASINLFKSIKFKCRGTDVKSGNIEGVTSSSSSYLFEQLFVMFLISIFTVLSIAYSGGYIGGKKSYYEFVYMGKKDTGQLKYYGPDTLSYLGQDTLVNVKLDDNNKYQIFISEYKRKKRDNVVVILLLLSSFLMLPLYMMWRLWRLKMRLEKVL